MSASPFHPDLRKLSTVPRWSIVERLRDQNVAEHCFYVAVYADALADLIGWKGDREKLLRHAIWHDAAEVITGDMPGPVKRTAMPTEQVRESFEEYLEKEVTTRYGAVPYRWEEDDVIAILKVANLIDEAMYIGGEIAKGNSTVLHNYEFVMERLSFWWRRLPGSGNSGFATVMGFIEQRRAGKNALVRNDASVER